MKLFPSERELARRHWHYFGRPFVTLFGIALLAGLIAGISWVVAGLLNSYFLR